MSATKARISHTVLKWARNEAGLALKDASRKANINPTKKKTAAERLEEWEQGLQAPTRKQLEALAKAYYRPVLTFYMKAPPRPDEGVHDFRTIGDHAVDLDSPELSALLRRMRARQKEIVELLVEDGDEVAPLSFVGRFTIEASPEKVVADIRQELQFEIDRQRKLNDKDALFRNLRNKVETIGVFVLLQGNLGSYHTNIEPDGFRGFALADPVAPFIIINSNDAKAAHIFTLIHELAHLWIGESGISNLSPFVKPGGGSDIETFCNRVSTEFLLPTDEFEEAWHRSDKTKIRGAVAALANEFNVSRAAVAHRLWSLNEIRDADWWNLYRTYQAEWHAHRERLQEQQGGPGYYITKRSQLGSALIRTVLGAVDAGTLTYTRASRILGVYAKGFDRLRAKAG